jgi:ribose/xylose/arabinose/galactoside ABC-type transport system permease subunit
MSAIGRSAGTSALGASAAIRRLAATPEGLVGLFLVGLCILLAVTEPLFATGINLQNLGRQNAVLIVLTVGLLFVLLVGGIDLSLAGAIAFTSVVAAHFADAGVQVWIAFVIAVAAAGCVGLINGLLIGPGRLSPIVVTLAMGQLLTGIALLMTRTGPINPGRNVGYGDLAGSKLGPVPTISIAAAAAILVAFVLLSRMSFGRYIRAVGGHETAAWLAGVPATLVKVSAYTMAGLFSGFAGILLSSRVGSGDASLGLNEMFAAYAAAFIGGVGFGTGTGRLGGVVIGALLLGVIVNGINLIGLATEFQFVISALLILMAISFQEVPRWLGRR